MTRLSLLVAPSAWRFALVGAVVSVPITVFGNLLSISEASIAGGIMIFGALIAGFVATIRSAQPDAAGVRAGLLGGVIAILTPFIAAASPIIQQTGIVQPSPSRIVFFVVASGVILVLSPLFGLVCGRIGGWMATTVTARWTAATS
jgi:hypothetical protein